MIDSTMKLRVEAKIQECLDVASAHFNKDFTFPNVYYTIRGRVAGRAHISGKKNNTIGFNPTLMADNFGDFLESTIPHEVAHLIAYKHYGRFIQPHGMEWKDTMVLLGANPNRLHNYDTSKVGYEFKYSCSTCGKVFNVGKRQHNNIQKNPWKYNHKCGRGRRGAIELVQKDSPTMTPVPVQPTPTPARAYMSDSPKATTTKPKKVNRMAVAREYVKSNPGIDSRALRTWVMSQTGCSEHGARGVWSKLKKEGLVN